MVKYRAVRIAGEIKWHIEVFDTQHQVSYDFINPFLSPKETMCFDSKNQAENFMISYLGVKNLEENETGVWFDGPV